MEPARSCRLLAFFREAMRFLNLLQLHRAGDWNRKFVPSCIFSQLIEPSRIWLHHKRFNMDIVICQLPPVLFCGDSLFGLTARLSPISCASVLAQFFTERHERGVA
jgi:hypothetical protein